MSDSKPIAPLDARPEPRGLIPKRVKSPFTRRTGILLLCLFLATIFWFMNALSNDYTTIITGDIIYVNEPPDKVPINALPAQMEVMVRAQGWQLLKTYFNYRPTFRVDVAGQAKRGSNVLKTRDYIGFFEDELDESFEVVAILSPETIRFEFDDKGQKQLPVILRSDVATKKQYVMAKIPQIDPDTITVTGPKSTLDTMTRVYTGHVHGKDIDEDFQIGVGIDKSASSTLDYDPDSVVVNFFVEQLTESSIEVPIKLVNKPAGEVRLLNQNARISFQLPLNQIDKVNDPAFLELFVVIADFAGMEPGQQQVPLEIASQPDQIWHAQLENKTVKFLLVK